MVSVCRGGPGCPPFLSFLLRGFGPARRGPFVSAKGPKTSGARAGPPRGGACAPVPVVWAAELAALRQSSPPKWKGRDRGTAPPGGARTTASSCHARSSIESRTGPDPPAVIPDPPSCHPRPPPAVIPDPDRGSRVFLFTDEGKAKTLDPYRLSGSLIKSGTSVKDDKSSLTAPGFPCHGPRCAGCWNPPSGIGTPR